MLNEDGLLIVNEPITKVVDDHPIISVKKHNQIILGPSKDGSNSIDSLTFIADRYYATINDLEATGKYKNLDKISHRDTISDYDINALPDADFEKEFSMLMDEDYECEKKIDRNKPLVVTDYWTYLPVKKGETPIPVVATFVAGVVIYRDKSPFGIEVGYPYSRGIYEPSLDDDLYDGIPDTEYIEEEQKIIGAVTRGIIDIMAKSANGQVGMANGMLEPDEERKRQAGQDYKFNPSIDPTRGIVQEKYPELPNSALQVVSMMENTMESASGKKMFGQGINGDTYGSVATGIKATVDATTQRMSSNIRKFNKAFVDIIKKMSELNKEFITDDKLIVLSDETYQTIRPDDLQTEVNIKIDISTPEMDDKTSNDLAFMIQTLNQLSIFPIK